MRPLPTRDQMIAAYQRSDPSAEGIFLVAVKTTGIFCRPVCRARKPRPENVEFYATPREALLGGFRPCKLCRPMDAQRAPTLVERLRQEVERDPAGRLTDQDLVALGVDPSTARRQFKQYIGMTFQAYQRARRMGLALREVRQGRKLLEVQMNRGYESSSAFRGAFAKIFGCAPNEARNRDCQLARMIETPLGTMLAVANDAGLHALDFVDRRGLEGKIKSLREHLDGTIVPGDHPHLDAIAAQLADYFAGTCLTFDLPMLTRGSDWERRVWQHLLTIPPGDTKSYAQMGRELDRPGSARAVGRANGRNYLAIVIPCHRVIRADGTLCGYGGGVWRKRWLLDHERRVLDEQTPSGTFALSNGREKR